MRIRTIATVAVASALLLGTAGCGVFTPTATLKHYNAADGVSADIGDLHVRNLVLIVNGNGDAGLVGNIVNNSTSLEFLTVEVRGATALSTETGAYPGNTKLGIADDNPVVFYGAGLVAGQYADVYLQYGDNEGQLITVPVLDGTDPIYAPYVPAAQLPAAIPAS